MALLYRLHVPFSVTLLGGLEVVTLPAGNKVEKDDFLQAAGLANVFLRGHRVMVITRDLLAHSQPVDARYESRNTSRR